MNPALSGLSLQGIIFRECKISKSERCGGGKEGAG